MAVDLSHFQESFFTESAEHVETMESGFLELEQRPQDLDLLNRIFRAAHSIKGNAGMFNFTAIAGLTHKMENVLDLMRNEEIPVTPHAVDVLLRALDGLKSLLDAAQGGGEADEAVIQGLEQELQACQDGDEGNAPPTKPSVTTPSVAPPANPWRLIKIDWVPLPELFQRGLDPAQMFKELHELGMVKVLQVQTEQIPPLEAMDPERCYLSWAVELETDVPMAKVEAVFDFVQDGRN